jgi:hypothetical protein
MPLDVLGRTRATLKHSTSPPRPTGLGNLLKLLRDGDRLLQLLIFNEEFLVSACHQRALITSLPFVHTARRSYRLNDPVRPPDWGDAFGSPDATLREAVQTLLFRGRRSRNKVSVGEPAEGSLPVSIPNPVRTGPRPILWLRAAASRAPPLGGARLASACSLPAPRGLGARGHAAECKSSRRSGGCGAVVVASRVRPAARPPPHPTVRARFSSRGLRGRRRAPRAHPHNPNNNSCRRISWLPQR